MHVCVQALRQAGMRDRHWEQLSEQLGMTLKPDKEFSLSKALEMHLMDHLDTIQKVSYSFHAKLLCHLCLLAYVHTLGQSLQACSTMNMPF